MCKLFGYIIGSLETQENAVKNIRKSLSKQIRFNRSLVTFSIVITGYAVMMDKIYTKKIERLEYELEELKRLKGD